MLVAGFFRVTPLPFSFSQRGKAEILTLDVAPFIYNGRTYLPLRSVGEAVGGAVEWAADSRTVIIKK